ncbi:MAG: hypothetical protein GXY83_29050 [Rhodopirellula sp.]|nr:hypothetical protein [Rhodopirellula sp.]
MVVELDQFDRVLASGSDEEKIAALKSMQGQIADGEPVDFFDLARRQVADKNTDVRWQALIVIGSYIPFGRRNEEIWNLIVEFCGIDDDMQDALATVLLEHLLEHDFDRTVERIKTAIPVRSVPLLGLLERCWQFGQPEAKWRQLRQIIEGCTETESR